MMIKLMLTSLLLIALSDSRRLYSSYPEPLSNDMVDFINKLNTTWKAGRNFGKHMTLRQYKNLLGLRLNVGKARLSVEVNDITTPLPQSFDARKKWSQCSTIGLIRDQSNCASCWAFAAVESMSDRICIHSSGRIQVNISAQHLLSCCKNCGGCHGGYMQPAWEYYRDHGIVTGGLYGTRDGCQPYRTPPCSGVYRPPSGCFMEHSTPHCLRSCRPGYGKSYNEDKHYGKTVYIIPGDERHIKAEIVKNGPVEAGMYVYADFGSYKSGVYKKEVESRNLGQHAVKILGWGVKNGTPYWLVANSWGSIWGDKGFFKILRGSNECGIEGNIVAGIPKL